jgi:hypothetical protein
MRDFIHRFYPYQTLKLMLQRLQRQQLPSSTTTTAVVHSSSPSSATTFPPPPLPFDPVQARAHLVSYFAALKHAATTSSPSSTTPSLSATRSQLTKSHLGFHLSIRSSQILNSGLGVFLNLHQNPSSTTSSHPVPPSTPPTIPAGTIVALYPGTLYRPGEAIFFNSLQNRYILKCEDGIFVDGKPTGLSGSIYRSANGRDNFPGCVPTADTTWLVNWTKVWCSLPTTASSSTTTSLQSSPASTFPTTRTTNTIPKAKDDEQGIDTSTTLKNPLAVGQIVNNGTAQFPPNVRYQELDIQTRDFPLELQEFLPNIWYSGDWHSYDHDEDDDDTNGGDRSNKDVERMPGSGGLDRLRTVVLVTTRPIEKDEELYSTYIE